MRAGHARQILFSVLVLGSIVPSSFADSKQLDERDRAVDWALGGLEQGSRLPRSAPANAPAGASRKAPGIAVSHTDTGAARAGRATTETNRTVRSGGTVANSPVSGGGQTRDNGGTGGGTTATPPTAGTGGTGITVEGETNLGGTGVSAGTGTQIETGTEPTAPSTETSTGGGETTGGIHVEAGCPAPNRRGPSPPCGRAHRAAWNRQNCLKLRRLAPAH